jgi:hypothetical protein
VLGQSPPDVAAETPATSDSAASAPESTEPTEPVEIAAPVETAAPVEGSPGEVAEREYDAYEVESLVPPPPRLRRSGFPRSMYPGRRLVVRAAVIALAAVFVAAIVADFRGFGRDTRSFAAEANAAAREKPPPATTTPATTAPPPVTTAVPGPDTRPPFVYNLATVFGCIGPRQTTTSALASVVDPGDHLAAVELVYVDTASGAETRKRMTASGGAFEAPIGPYAADGTITWQVIATDEAGNSSNGEGPSVAASAAC